jgi:hypothetical protein
MVMKPMHANGPADKAFEMVLNVISFPAKLQGMALNAIINTIDKAQTDAVMRESAELQKSKTPKKD